MLAPFNPAMLTLAREARGLTQTDLAKTINLTQTTVSRYESSFIDPTPEILEKVAASLDFPTQFFSQNQPVFGVGSGCEYFHRKRQDLSARDLKVLHARANILRFQVQSLLKKFAHNWNFSTPIDNQDFIPEQLAVNSRENWDLPMGPIESVIGAIEKAGGIVLSWPFGTRKIDAFSQWPPGQPPFIFVNSEAPGDRLRLTVSHELGHIFMHNSPKRDMEQEADRFAAEFLMPAAEIRTELVSLSLPDASRLKPRWKTSMAAIVKRAHTLRCISDWEYKKLFMSLSQNGWRLQEPFPILSEKPRLVQSIITYLIEEMWYDIPSLCDMLSTNEADFRKYLLPDPQAGAAY